MTFTGLDRQTALLVIDLQQGIVGLPLVHPVDEVIGRASALIEAFRRAGRPIVLVNVAGSPPGRTDRGSGNRQAFPDGFTELIPELGQQPEDIVVTKYARSAFSGTGLTERLRDLGVTQVVVIGIATSIGVQLTARSAHEDGFSVALPVDAMTDLDSAAHDHSVSQVFPTIAETGTTDDLLRLLDQSGS